MKISFEINSRLRKDGKQNLRIRITDGRKVKKQLLNTPLNIYKQYWDKDSDRVTNNILNTKPLIEL